MYGCGSLGDLIFKLSWNSNDGSDFVLPLYFNWCSRCWFSRFCFFFYAAWIRWLGLASTGSVVKVVTVCPDLLLVLLWSGTVARYNPVSISIRTHMPHLFHVNCTFCFTFISIYSHASGLSFLLFFPHFHHPLSSKVSYFKVPSRKMTNSALTSKEALRFAF